MYAFYIVHVFTHAVRTRQRTKVSPKTLVDRSAQTAVRSKPVCKQMRTPPNRFTRARDNGSSVLRTENARSRRPRPALPDAVVGAYFVGQVAIESGGVALGLATAAGAGAAAAGPQLTVFESTRMDLRRKTMKPTDSVHRSRANEKQQNQKRGTGLLARLPRQRDVGERRLAEE